ncbi:hypothetical protein YB2330_001634 [Saitoella coloradoensis]
MFFALASPKEPLPVSVQAVYEERSTVVNKRTSKMIPEKWKTKEFWDKFQVPKDEDAGYDNTTWCNRDLIPIPPDRRTWDVWGYFGYWTVSGSCVSAWTIGSTMLAFGLNAKQAMACVTVGGILTGFLAVACGWMGEVHKIGFTVSSRFSYGMRGAYFTVIIRAFIASMWFGMQAYWGGQAIKAVIGAVIPGFIHGSLNDYTSASSHLAKNDFIGFILFLLAFFGMVLIPPERLQLPFALSFFAFTGACFGILGWAVHTAGGAGPLFASSAANESGLSTGWGILYGITALLGSWGAGCLGQSDWTRYAKRRGAPILSQMVAAPLTITITALIGVIVTSCVKEIMGEIVWNPIYLLPKIQDYYGSSPGARAGVFFAALGLVLSQMSITVVLNSVSTGMDLAGLAPKWINIIRGSYLMACIGILTQPWQLLATATKFLTVLSGFGIFVAPMTGVMLGDFLVVRRQMLKIPDLYTDDRRAIYWYPNKYCDGINWRGFLAFFTGVLPLLPGLIAASGIEGIPIGFSRLYNLTFIVGIAISFVMMIILCKISPPPGLGEEAQWSEMTALEGLSPTESSEKTMTDKEKEISRMNVVTYDA